ncbi:hypothetical protein H0H93_010271 [Arthromyces matolae]|nr:hypothetical protein H0H93_010271 [Arthromyces matolae]
MVSMPLEQAISLHLRIWRVVHTDMEDTLAELAKGAGSFALASMITGGRKFNGLDVKRVYFGNWLRDYSQARDRHRVLEENASSDDPESPYGSRLHDQGTWDTSKALVRRLLERCIHLGRMHRSQGRKEDEYEAYRLLGTLLHTLEDFTAHSNWCEIALVNMGHRDVFLHVGDQVRVQAPNGEWVAPIVTGTFGSSDFFHSLLGEATDHLSQASVTDLNKSLDKARSASSSSRSGGGDVLRDLFFSIPGGGGSELSREMDAVERIRAGPSAGGKAPEQMTPQELHGVLWQVLTFRDSVMKKIEKTIEKIPGLNSLIEKIGDSISVFVFTTLEPFLRPILQTSTSALSEISGEVINNNDQYEVFNDPRANLILNEPAGLVAKVVVKNTVGLVIKAWDDTSINVNALSEEILECLFHPSFTSHSSRIQQAMLSELSHWVSSLGSKRSSILSRLTKEAVRSHQNVRHASEGGQSAAQGTWAQSEGMQVQSAVLGYVGGVAHGIPGVGQATEFFSGGGGGHGGGHGHGQKKHDDKHDKHDKHEDKHKKHEDKHNKHEHGYSRDGDTFEASNNSNSSKSYYAPPSGPPPSFPGSGSSYEPSYGPSSGDPYAPPSGPPSSFPGSGNSSYTPPPPSFPGSYAPPSGPPPSFPGEGPGYASSYGGGTTQGGYAPSYGQAPGFPSGPGPAFPGAQPNQSFGFPEAGPGQEGYAPGYGQRPQFPDAQTQRFPDWCPV